jgi:hypothetical protein
MTASCPICRDLPESADYKPPAFSKLVSLVGGDEDLLKCPVCHTYYEYSYAYYPGAPDFSCDPHEDESLRRRTAAEATRWIRAALAKGDNTALARELELLST